MKKENLLVAGVVLSLLLSGYAAVQSHRTAASILTQQSESAAADDKKSIGLGTVTSVHESVPSASRKVSESGPSPSGNATSHKENTETTASASPPSTSPHQLSVLSSEGKKAMEEAIEDAVDAKLREQEQEKRKREENRERTKWGEWNAPIDELAEDLRMDSAQKEAAGQIFDQARGKFADMLDVKRPDGTSVLSDFAEDLKSGVPQEEAVADFEYAIQHDLVPGTENSILSELLSIKDDVVTQLGEHLDRDQVTEFKKLKVDSLQVETGYDPIRDYIVDYMKR